MHSSIHKSQKPEYRLSPNITFIQLPKNSAIPNNKALHKTRYILVIMRSAKPIFFVCFEIASHHPVMRVFLHFTRSCGLFQKHKTYIPIRTFTTSYVLESPENKKNKNFFVSYITSAIKSYIEWLWPVAHIVQFITRCLRSSEMEKTIFGVNYVLYAIRSKV